MGVIGNEGFVGRPGPRAERGLPGLPGERGPPGQKVLNIIIYCLNCMYSIPMCAFMLNSWPFLRETQDWRGTGEPQGWRAWWGRQVTRAEKVKREPKGSRWVLPVSGGCINALFYRSFWSSFHIQAGCWEVSLWLAPLLQFLLFSTSEVRQHTRFYSQGRFKGIGIISDLF